MRVITGDLGNTSISQCQFTVSGLRCADNCNLVWMEWKKVWVGVVCLWRRVTHVRCSGGDRRSSIRRRAAAQQPGHDHGAPQCNDTNNYTRASFITVRTAEQNLGDCNTLYCPHKSVSWASVRNLLRVWEAWEVMFCRLFTKRPAFCAAYPLAQTFYPGTPRPNLSHKQVSKLISSKWNWIQHQHRQTDQMRIWTGV